MVVEQWSGCAAVFSGVHAGQEALIGTLLDLPPSLFYCFVWLFQPSGNNRHDVVVPGLYFHQGGCVPCETQIRFPVNRKIDQAASHFPAPSEACLAKKSLVMSAGIDLLTSNVGPHVSP